MRFLFFFALLAVQAGALAQDIPSFKFGKVSAAALSVKSYPVDSNAAAVLLADVGSSAIKGNNKGWFSLEYKLLRRIHILKSSAFDKATVEIKLYTNGEDEEELDDLKAVTYNLEDGKVTETKLNVKSSVFKERIDKNTVIKRFTLPNVKEGSIIEYEFKLTSDFLFNIQPWNFQGDIPRLWSQYTVTIPQFMNYMLIPQGNLTYYSSDRKDKMESYFVEVRRELGPGAFVTDRFNISCGVSDFRWVMKDVPAFKEEAFTSAALNYVARHEFQLAGYLAPLNEEKIMTTWADMTTRLLKREDFGEQLNKTAAWWPADLEKLLKGTGGETDIARKIFSYVRDNYTCTSHSQLFVEESLKKTAGKKNGGVAEINLLLTALCRYAGLQAEPVILSSRGHAFVSERYPVATRFNYVICRIYADGKEILLDASYPHLGFGKLPYECYNGMARVVNEAATEISLRPDMLTESSQTSVFLGYTPGGKWTGQVNKRYGYFASEKARQTVRKEGMDGLTGELKRIYGNDFTVDSLLADSLAFLESPITLQYRLRFQNEEAAVIYFNPVLGERYKQNPFKSDNRRYPVEMPYKTNEFYSLTMEVPPGYVVEEMPRPVSLKLNVQGDAVFDYRISQSNGYINLQYKLDIRKAVFSPVEYDLLRVFFGNMVAKLDEQIVLKKK